jgi:microcystin-dependent protein
MKRLFVILVAMILTAGVFIPCQLINGQSPDKLSYQAVIRSLYGDLVTNSTVGIRIQILQTSEFGAAVYVETHTPTTNDNGLATLEIGSGSVVLGTFSDIDWANGLYFIKTEIDPTGGISYGITGISQLLSVPYALHSKTAESLTGVIPETDPVFGASAANNIVIDDVNRWNAGILPAIGNEGNLLTYDGDNWVAKDLLITTNNTGSGTPTNIVQPSLVLSYCIALAGVFPSRNSAEPLLGEIAIFPYNFNPRSWAYCDGQLLAISSNTALFSLLGTTFGGDGMTTFALPDLRGRVAMHQGTGAGLSARTLGQRFGSESTTITIANLPAHNHTVNISFED